MADPVTVVDEDAEADGDGVAEADVEVDGTGVADVSELPADVPEASDVPDEPDVPPAVVELTELDAATTSSPTPYSFKPTVAPMTTTMTVKRTVPRQGVLLMTCSVLLGG
jgi:hypothetical protein